MNSKVSDRIRALAQAKYAKPAILAGKGQFSIRVRDVLGDLQAEGFPPGNTPLVCNALRTAKFLRENGLEIERVDGPPSKMSPTVVVHYRVTEPRIHIGVSSELPREEGKQAEEDSSARARRLTERLKGVLKDELAEYGGGEAFLRWIRSEDEDAA